MEKWTVVAVGSLAAISVFSLYVGVHLARGILCNYVYATPYALPLVYVLGFFLGYAIPQMEKEHRNIADLFDGDEKVVVEVALRGGMQSEVARKIGKVKAHRVIRAMENRGLITKTKKGNTFRIHPGKRLRKFV